MLVAVDAVMEIIQRLRRQEDPEAAELVAITMVMETMEPTN